MKRVRSSKYRHVYGEPNGKDKCFDNIKLTKNAFDANLAKSNGKYVSLNWEASGGGCFAVLPTNELGKIPDLFPLFDGHKGPVLDTDWNPFDENVVVSASDDGTIGVWKVPENFSVHVEYESLDVCKNVQPVKFLEGHGKKVGHVSFNPVAENILASSSLDNSVKIWNVETGDVLFTLQHPSFVTSFSWNYDGTKIATVCKDKQLRIWDVRNEKILSQGKGHSGAKGSRVIWLGDHDRILTTGFSLISDREMAVWDASDISKGPMGGFKGLDPSSGIVIPHYDPMTSMVYLGGRGDGKLVYFEYADDTLYDLFAYNSTSPQRGLGWVPNSSLNIHEHEVARVYKVHETMVEPISFKVPLKSDGFLDNVYTYFEAGKPALTAEEWKSGKTARPLVKNWKNVFDGKEGEVYDAPKLSHRKSHNAESDTSKKSLAKNSLNSSTSGAEATTNSDTKVSNGTDTGGSIPRSTERDGKKDEVNSTNNIKEKISALIKAEKQDSYDVLQSQEVKSFLEKTSQEDDKPAHNTDVKNSDWDSDPESSFSTFTFTKKKTESANSDSSLKSKPNESKEDPKAKETEKESIRAQIKREAAKLESMSRTDKAEDEELSFGQKSVYNRSDSEKLDEILRKLDSLSSRITKLENDSN